MSDDTREDALEAAFWRFDALHKSHYADADSQLPGPMSERDAFKRVVRGLMRRVETFTRDIGWEESAAQRGEALGVQLLAQVHVRARDIVEITRHPYDVHLRREMLRPPPPIIIERDGHWADGLENISREPNEKP